MSEELAKKLSPSYVGKVITDSLGRKITLKHPDPIDRYYLRRAMGKDAENRALEEMMLPLLFVDTVDSIRMDRALSLQECLANLKRLGDEGSMAVGEALFEAAPDHREEIAEIKK